MESVKGRGYKEETIGTLSAFGADILKMEDDKKGSRSSSARGEPTMLILAARSLLFRLTRTSLAK